MWISLKIESKLKVFVNEFLDALMSLSDQTSPYFLNVVTLSRLETSALVVVEVQNVGRMHIGLTVLSDFMWRVVKSRPPEYHPRIYYQILDAHNNSVFPKLSTVLFKYRVSFDKSVPYKVFYSELLNLSSKFTASVPSNIESEYTDYIFELEFLSTEAACDFLSALEDLSDELVERFEAEGHAVSCWKDGELYK